MRTMLATALTALALGTACASGGSSDGPRRSPNLITLEELAEVPTLNAEEAIQRLRPRWLQSRGPANLRGDPALPVVYVDRSRFGEIDSLRQLIVQDIDHIRFLSATDATTRYGTGHAGGAIEVVSKRRD